MIRSFITRTDVLRVAMGWGAFVALLALHPLLAPPVPGPLLIVALVAIVAVILVCAFGVVKQAEALAHRLDDPYGSLVLTLSIVLIEVILISAVMLGPGEHATIARDSVMAVSMIILNLVIGLALLLGGLRHRGMAHNRTGTSAYLSMLVVLIALAFGLPGLIGHGGAYTVGQELPIIVLTLVLYAFFLFRQMGAQADDFTEVDERLRPAHTAANAAPRTPIREVLPAHRVEVLTRLVLLVVTVVPIVLLSHDMAALLDDGLGRLGAPVALAGLLTAGIVLRPEALTSIRAALNGMLTGQEVVLAESPANLLMLAVTLLLSVTTFAAKRVTAMHGAAHLATFAVYVLILFS